MSRVDESIKISELKFNRRPDAMLAHHLSVLANDLQAVLYRTLMVVRQVQDKKTSKIKVGFHAAPSYRFPLLFICESSGGIPSLPVYHDGPALLRRTVCCCHYQHRFQTSLGR